MKTLLEKGDLTVVIVTRPVYIRFVNLIIRIIDKKIATWWFGDVRICLFVKKNIMAASIVNPEVAFPFGEAINITSNEVTCEIIPYKDDQGNPTERGKIIVTLPYVDATVQSSDLTTKPRERLFSVCNKDNPGEIFRIPSSCEAKFIIDHRKTTSTDPDIANKQLHIILTGEGPKKNSMGD